MTLNHGVWGHRPLGLGVCFSELVIFIIVSHLHASLVHLPACSCEPLGCRSLEVWVMASFRERIKEPGLTWAHLVYLQAGRMGNTCSLWINTPKTFLHQVALIISSLLFFLLVRLYQ